MNRYRFKTEQEFRNCDKWDEEAGCPLNWNLEGEMNEYMGHEITDESALMLCESNDGFKTGAWCFNNYDYVIMEETSIFQKGSLFGRYVQVLNDSNIGHYPCKNGDYLKYFATKAEFDYWGAYMYDGICNIPTSIDGKDSKYFGINVHEDHRFKLMPKGFTPETKLYKVALFPSEGCCVLNGNLIDYLKHIMPNQNLIMQTNHTLVAWNSHSFWFCVGASSKKEYTMYELSDVIKDVPITPSPVTKTFKVGDYIIGNSTANDRYAMTREGWKGIVTEIINDREIKAECLRNRDSEYTLVKDYFDVMPILSLSELKSPVTKSGIHIHGKSVNPFGELELPREDMLQILTTSKEKVKLLPLIAVKTRIII